MCHDIHVSNMSVLIVAGSSSQGTSMTATVPDEAAEQAAKYVAANSFSNMAAGTGVRHAASAASRPPRRVLIPVMPLSPPPVLRDRAARRLNSSGSAPDLGEIHAGMSRCEVLIAREGLVPRTRRLVPRSRGLGELRHVQLHNIADDQ